MKEEDKTKEQLMNELAEMRQRVAELEAADAERKRAEEKLEHLNLVLRAIRNVNQLITRERDRHRLLQGACESLIETRGYHNAWIALTDEDGRLVTTAEAGLGEAFLPLAEQLKRGELTACGRRALAQAGVVVTEDPSLACADCPLATNYAGRGAMAVRLEHGGKVYGLLSVSIPRDLVASEEEQALFEEAAADIAFALHSIELEEERKRAVEALRESEQFLQDTFEGIQDGISVLDGDLNIMRVNAWMKRTYASHAPLAGKKCYAVYQQRETPCPWCPSLPAMETGESHSEIVPYPSKENPTGWIDLSAYPLKDITGHVIGVIEHVKDITERKRAEEALRESEEKYRLLVENSRETIFVAQDGMLKFFNSQTMGITGYSREELASKPFVELIHPDDREMVVERHLKRLKGESLPHVYPFRIIERSGNIKWVEINAALITWEGKPATLNFLSDITERKRAEEALKEYSERLEEMVEERTKELRDAQEELVRKGKLAILGQLAGGVGHELRNPLGVISNAVYFLQMTLPDADETTATAKEYLEIIAEEVRNSSKIISDLLDFSCTRMPEREEIAVSELVAEVLEKRPPPEGVEVTTRIAPDLPPVYVDPRQMGLVLVNLVVNAYQAMKEGGALTIKTSEVSEKLPKSKWIALSASDTGCGISPENMTKLFEPLFTTKARGIGLGLATSRILVEANGGSMEVESEEGKGSTFTVRLPTRGW